MQPFWQQTMVPPADNGATSPLLSLVQGEQPPSNRSQAYPPYRVPQMPPGRAEAEAKIAARRAATMVDGKAPQITGVRARQPRCRRHMCACADRVLDTRFCVVTLGVFLRCAADVELAAHCNGAEKMLMKGGCLTSRTM
jgi:hypothetical protein